MRNSASAAEKVPPEGRCVPCSSAETSAACGSAPGAEPQAARHRREGHPLLELLGGPGGDPRPAVRRLPGQGREDRRLADARLAGDQDNLSLAGTDIVRPLNPMTNVWGMVTRGTKAAGVQGPEHAIDVATALRLYTLGTAELNGDADRLGSVTPGKLADLVAYPLDPLAASPDDLAPLTPAFTIVGGRPVHDPDKRLAR
jgi:Amidohydrolase family